MMGQIIYIDVDRGEMNIIRILILWAVVSHAFGQSSEGASLKDLDVAIAQRDRITQEKMSRIEAYKRRLPGTTSAERYELNVLIFNEYKTFIYDSAFRYARKLQKLAAGMSNPVPAMEAKINLGFTLVSSGLFNETLDTLQTVSAISLPDTLKTGFYYLIGRTCYELSDFARDEYYSVRYTDRGNLYLDSALAFLPDDRAQYLMMKGLRCVHSNDWETARNAYEILINDFTLTNPEMGVAASTLSFIYLNLGNREQAKGMLVKAAIADIHASTKETVALTNLAKLLYQDGNIEKAYEYIKIAMEDANFYGANHRKIQVATVYPAIEGQHLGLVNSRKKVLMAYAVGITFLSIIMIGFGFLLYRQFKKLQAAKKVISDSNEKLLQTNHQLVDSNKIKEEYVTYYFNTTADYISRLENLKKSIEMKLMTKKMDDLRFVVENINIKKERDDLYNNFDKVFLKLFPDFVDVFQSLFREEDRAQLKDGQLLNTEMRIFALMRMGINDNEKISKILDYSVTTIYTYKTRARNKSIVENEEFDKRIMAIRTL